MKTYKIYLGNQEFKEVKGKSFKMPGSKYNFFVYNDKISNVETGYGVSLLNFYNENPNHENFQTIDCTIERILNTEFNPEWIAKKTEIREKIAENFYVIFKKPLTHFYNLIFGFDIIRFDENFIKSFNEESVSEAVERKFGKDARQLINDIFSFESEYENLY